MLKDYFCPRKVTIIIFIFLAVSSNIILYGQEKSKKPQVSFNVNVKLKLFDVLALDDDDKPVKDLKKEDFELFIDGKPWPIQTFDVKDFSSIPETENSGVANQLKYTAETDDFFDKRLSIFIFNDLRVLKKPRETMAMAVYEFLDKKFTKDDLIAIYYMKGPTILMLQPFTDNKQLLKDVIQKALVDGEYNIKFNWGMSSLYIPRIINGGRIENIPLEGVWDQPWSAGNIEEFRKEQYKQRGIKARTSIVTNFHLLINSLALFKGRKDIYLISESYPFSYYGSAQVFNNFKRLTIDARNNNVTINALDLYKHSYQNSMMDISYYRPTFPVNDFLIGLAAMTDGDYYRNCNRKNKLIESLTKISEKSGHVYYLGAYIQDLQPEEKYDIEIKTKRENVNLIFHDVFRTKPEYEEMDDVDQKIHFLEAFYGSYSLNNYPFKSEILQFPYGRDLTLTVTVFEPEAIEKSSSRYDAAVRYFNTDTKNDSQEIQDWDIKDTFVKNSFLRYQVFLGAKVVDDEYIYRHVLRDTDSGAIRNVKGKVKLGLKDKLLSSIISFTPDPTVLILFNLLNRKEEIETDEEDETGQKQVGFVFEPSWDPLVFNNKVLTMPINRPVDSEKPVYIMYMYNQDKLAVNSYILNISLLDENDEVSPIRMQKALPETEFPGGWRRVTLEIPKDTLIKLNGKYTFRIEVVDKTGNMIEKQERMIVTQQLYNF